MLDQTSSPMLALIEHPAASAPVHPSRRAALCHTDGLIEDPERPRDDPIAELAAVVDAHSDHIPDDLCDQLILPPRR